MKKIFAFLCGLAIFISIIRVPSSEIDASNTAGLTIAVSESNMEVGDKLTLTVTVPNGGSAVVDLSYNSSVMEYEGASASATSNNGKVVLNIPKGTTTTKASVRFKALNAGSSTFKAVTNSAKTRDDKPVTLNATGTTVLVAKNIEQETSNSNNNQEIRNKKASEESNKTQDNEANQKLSSQLKLNEKTENKNNQDLKEETKEAKETNEINETVEETEDFEYTFSNVKTFFYNEKSYEVESVIPDELVPKDFLKQTIKLGDNEYMSLKYEKADLTLLCLNEQIFSQNDDSTETKNQKLFIYDSLEDEVYPFIKLETNGHYVIPIVPPEEKIEEGYKKTPIFLDNGDTIIAYQKKDVSEVKLDEFYLIYCYNDKGSINWYEYDLSEGTFMRYAKTLNVNQVENDKPGQYVIDYVKENTDVQRAIIGAFIASLVIVNFLYLRKIRRIKKQLKRQELFSQKGEEHSENKQHRSYEYSQTELQNAEKFGSEDNYLNLSEDSDFEYIDINN